MRAVMANFMSGKYVEALNFPGRDPVKNRKWVTVPLQLKFMVYKKVFYIQRDCSVIIVFDFF